MIEIPDAPTLEDAIKPRIDGQFSSEFFYNSEPVCRRGESRRDSILRRPYESPTHIFEDRARKPSSFPTRLVPEDDVGRAFSRLLEDEDIRAAMSNGGVRNPLLKSKLELILGRMADENEELGRKNCSFCYPNVESKTPEPRIRHEKLIIPGFGPVITVPNLFPFGEDHLVTIFTGHKTSLEELSKIDMVNYFDSVFDIANRYVKNKHYGMASFINWGKEAAASQPHPHIQNCAIRDRQNYATTGMGQEFRTCTFLRERYVQNPYEVFVDMMRKMPCFIFENDEIFVYAGFAPRHPDEVDILFKNVSNILELNTEHKRRIAAESALGVFHALYLKRGVTSLNTVLHQSPFNISYKDTCFLMHLHVIPRNKNNHGGSEKGRCFDVVDTYPEDTAKALREHYCH